LIPPILCSHKIETSKDVVAYSLIFANKLSISNYNANAIIKKLWNLISNNYDSAIIKKLLDLISTMESWEEINQYLYEYYTSPFSPRPKNPLVMPPESLWLTILLGLAITFSMVRTPSQGKLWPLAHLMNWKLTWPWYSRVVTFEDNADTCQCSNITLHMSEARTYHSGKQICNEYTDHKIWCWVVDKKIIPCWLWILSIGTFSLGMGSNKTFVISPI